MGGLVVSRCLFMSTLRSLSVIPRFFLLSDLVFANALKPRLASYLAIESSYLN